MLTIKTMMKVTVAGTVRVWAEVYDQDGNKVDERTLPKNAAAGTYMLASERVMGYDASSALENHEPFATIKRRRPVNISIFGLKEANGKAQTTTEAAEYEEVGC